MPNPGTTPPGLTIAPVRMADAEELFGALDHPAVAESLGWPDVTSVDAVRARLVRLAAGPGPDATATAWLNFVVRREADSATPGVLLGRLEASVHAGWAEIAYVFDPRQWGHGYATESVRWLLEHLRAEHAVADAWAAVAPGNRRSLALLERLGFVPAPVTDAARLESADDADITLHRRLTEGEQA